MFYKPSRYNVITRDFDDNIIIANVLEKSFAKLTGDNREDILCVLQRDTIDENINIQYPYLKEKHFIVNKEIDEMAIANLRYNQLIYSNDILDITIIPTDACNFNCIYCYQEDRVYEFMDKKNAEIILKYIEKNCHYYKKVAINWFGGEPLLMKDLIIWFMERANFICKKVGVPLTGGMSTNGYDLDMETFSQFIKNKLTYFQITIDGTEETHNRQRPHKTNADSYKKIISNLDVIDKKIKNYYKISIRINITKSIFNDLENVLKEFQKFSNNNKFRIHWQLVRDYGGEKIHNLENEVLEDQEQFNEFIDIATKYNIASLYEIYFNFGAGLCSACRDHSLLIDHKANIHKCTLAIYDKAATENKIGAIDKNGELLIDDYKNAAWLLRNEPKESCKDCACYPLCFNAVCPYTRKFKNKDICYSEKDRLQYYLRDMSKRQLIKTYIV